MKIKKEIIIYTLVSVISLFFGIILATAFVKQDCKSIIDNNIIKADKKSLELQNFNLKNQIKDLKKQILDLKEANEKLSVKDNTKKYNEENSETLFVNVNITNTESKIDVKEKLNSIKKEAKLNNKKRKEKKQHIQRGKEEVERKVDTKKTTVNDEALNNNGEQDTNNDFKTIKTIEPIVQKVEQPQRVSYVKDVKTKAEKKKDESRKYEKNNDNYQDEKIVYNTIIIEDED